MTLFYTNKNLNTTWELYNGTVKKIYDLYNNPKRCIYCNSGMREDNVQLEKADILRAGKQIFIRFSLCDCCGWWSARHYSEENMGKYDYSSMEDLTTDDLISAACGTLTELRKDELSSLSIQEIRKYLLVNNEQRYNISPARFEELVEHVYRNVGYRTELVGRTGDGGIDIIMLSNNNDLVGVQVKRYKNKIGVEEIREFMGALYVEEYVRGIFVTTSSYTYGAKEYSNRLQYRRRFPIELVDSTALLSFLRVVPEGEIMDVKSHPAMQEILSGKRHLTTILSCGNQWGEFRNVYMYLDGQLIHVTPTGNRDTLPV